uniref:Uncharacterized protein n=1 Tax=Wuchereria bancrofti TaxID=6293 RepID=A0AAF5PLL8_WUCBA
MYSDNPETFAVFLSEYQMKYGYTTEKDLFIAQAVLQNRMCFAFTATICRCYATVSRRVP